MLLLASWPKTQSRTWSGCRAGVTVSSCLSMRMIDAGVEGMLPFGPTGGDNGQISSPAQRVLYVSMYDK